MSGASDTLRMLLRELKLPSFVMHHESLAEQAEQGGWSFRDYLAQLAELEVKERKERKIERLRRASQLPAEKTLATLECSRLPAPVRRQLPVLCEGGLVERCENLLVFGLPGRGKTHLVCADTRIPDRSCSADRGCRGCLGREAGRGGRPLTTTMHKCNCRRCTNVVDVGQLVVLR